MYKYKTIELLEPTFKSSLTDLIIDLDHLRKRELSGTTPPLIFFQLKSLFHTLESIESARIEGNHTTVAEFIEVKLAEESSTKKPSIDEQISEIKNVEKAMKFIDGTIDENDINESYIKELHKIVVNKLDFKKEGDKNPGKYRKSNVKISGSNHKPPDYTQVASYMQKLMSFMENNDSSKYDLLKIALFHHRFVWIHPFGNGNGRTIRLITYAQLVKYGFNVNIGHIVNPSAIFCNNRANYNLYLSKADGGSKKELNRWCEYVLKGLKKEIGKIDKLLDYKYLSKNVLIPAIQDSLDHKILTPIEASILKIAVRKKRFKASDLKVLFPNKASSHISRAIAKLKKKKMIVDDINKKRTYSLSFESNYLIRGVIKFLDENGFLSLE
jgi:Fic family protein